MLRRVLATWGNADFGRLGQGPLASQLRPRALPNLSDAGNVKQVAAGGAHTAFVSDDGTVYTFGLNDHGQLGHSEGEDHCSVPREVLLPESIVSVSCGHYHTMALAESGRIWAFGKNSSGQLGLGRGSPATVAMPSLVKDLDGAEVTEVCTGAEHTLARTAGGEVYSWGCTKNGKLGHGKDSYFAAWKEVHKAPRLIRSLRGVAATGLCAGHTASGIIDDSGGLYTMGYGRFWQLGLGHDRDQLTPELVMGAGGVEQVAMGGLHTVAVKRGGNVMVWGGNEHGCLGYGQPGIAVRSPVMLNPKVLLASQVSCGWQHTCAVSRNSEIFSWGWGGSAGDASSFDGNFESGGQLGLGNDFDFWGPKAVSSAILEGQHLPQDQFDESFTAAFSFLSVSCGFNHTAAIIDLCPE